MQIHSNRQHEFRSPINRIRGLARILAQDVHLSTEERQALLKMIEDSADRLQRSTYALLLYASWEEVPIDRMTTSAPAFHEDLIAAIRPHLDSGKIQLEWSAEESAVGRFDALLVADAAEQLAHNAIRFAQRGVLKAKWDVATGLLISVLDEGPGMQHTDQATAPFWQESHGLNRAKNGLGLGLTLVKRVAEAHGGTFFITQNEQGGCTASMHLPADVLSVH